MTDPCEDVRALSVDDYDYPLPEERIAAHPLPDRASCKLLVRRHDGSLADHTFSDLPELLAPMRPLLVFNNTRVINARLRFRKPVTGALIEVFCLEPRRPAEHQENFASTRGCSWLCFVGNSKKWKEGRLDMPLTVGGRTLTLSAERVTREGNAFTVDFTWDDPTVSFAEIIATAGELPIPPYLNRATEESDLTDYQTVYSRIDGSVAAPTAGLHFTPELLDELKALGTECREVTLHVGAGTFQPVKTDTIGDHEMHEEFFTVSLDMIDSLAATERPILAVGTTSVRTLESLYHAGCMAACREWEGVVGQWYPYSPGHPRLSRSEAFAALARHCRETGETTFAGTTRLLIAPGYDFKAVDAIITNFHQPRSTLLLLVSAFTGGDWQPLYRHGLDSGYRFLSYGDAQLLL